MTHVIVLDQWLPVETPVGKGYAFIIELEQADNWYTIALDSQAIVTLPQEKVLMRKDYTHGRGMSAPDMLGAVQRFKDKLHGDDPRRQGEGPAKG